MKRGTDPADSLLPLWIIVILTAIVCWASFARADAHIEQITVYRGDVAEMTYRPPPGVTVVKWRWTDGREGYQTAILSDGPATQPASRPVDPPDTFRVGPDRPLKTLADVQGAMADDAAFIFDDGVYEFDSNSGLTIQHSRVVLIAAADDTPDETPVFRSTGTYQYPQAIDVVRGGDFLHVEGITFEGPAKTRAIRVREYAEGLVVKRCSAPLDGLGQFIEFAGAKNATVTDCVAPGLRRYFIYGKVDGLLVERCKVGTSLGGFWNGRRFDSEHGIRLNTHARAIIRDCEITELKKNCIAFRKGTDSLVENCDLIGPAPIMVGPLSGGDGHPEDPTERVTDTRVIGNRMNGRIELEMGSAGTLIENNDFDVRTTAVKVRFDRRYEAHRPRATGIIRSNRIKGTGIVTGDSSGLTIEGNNLQ